MASEGAGHGEPAWHLLVGDVPDSEWNASFGLNIRISFGLNVWPRSN